MTADVHSEAPASGWRALPNRDRFLVVFRLGFALLVLAAVATQLVDQVRNGGSIANFFSFFTIQSNLIIVVVFAASAGLLLAGREPAWWDRVRGAAAAYMVTTGIVYLLLLSGLEEDLQTVIPWVNGALHYWMPVAAALDWILDRPNARIPFRVALTWLAFPLSWLAYTLIRATFVDWYPYPFLDPGHEDQGAAQVAITTVVIFVAFTGLAWVLAWTSAIRLRAGTT